MPRGNGKRVFHVYCPSGHRLRAKREQVGTEKTCPVCTARFKVTRVTLSRDVDEPVAEGEGAASEKAKPLPQDKNPARHPFDLDHTVFRLGDADPVSWRDLQRGLLTVGSTGSGKTSSVLKLALLSSLRLGAGAIFFTTKSSDCAAYRELARLAGRSDDLVVIDEDREVFNWLDWESRRRQGSFSNNVVELLCALVKLADGNADQQGGDAFWRLAQKQLIRNCIELLILAGDSISLLNMQRVMSSMPNSPEQRDDPDWQKSSFCNALLNRCMQKGLNASDDADFELIGTYFLRQMAELHPKTRGIIVSSLTGLIDIFLRGKFRRLFSSGPSTVTPEQCWADHKNLIIVDLPIDVHQESGRLAQLLIKRCFQRAVQAREPQKNQRPVLCVIDEVQYFLDPDADLLYTSNCRSKGVVNFWLTQSIDAVYSACGGGPKGEQIANAILANLSNKIFLQQPGNSADWASRMIGQDYRYLDYGGGSTSPSAMGCGTGGAAKQLQPRLLANSFYNLKTGGAINDFLVEGIVWQGGSNFSTGKPFLKVAFDQRFGEEESP